MRSKATRDLIGDVYMGIAGGVILLLAALGILMPRVSHEHCRWRQRRSVPPEL